jgi:hypothetical protein
VERSEAHALSGAVVLNRGVSPRRRAVVHHEDVQLRIGLKRAAVSKIRTAYGDVNRCVKDDPTLVPMYFAYLASHQK